MSQIHANNAPDEDYVVPLSTKGVIEISGEERIKYLQGQVTADMEQLTDDNSLLACHCDFKGKIWSVFYSVPWQDKVLLITHHSVLQQSLSELKKYGVFSKVNIEETTESWSISGGCGKKFEQSIEGIFGQLPNGHLATVQNEHGVVISLNQPKQRYIVMLVNGSQLSCKTGNEEANWLFDDIAAGVAEVREQASNEYVPQMLNLQAIGAINFEKGCYMGQEVVARTKFLGRNKRAAFILKTDSHLADLTGEQLEYQIGENWRPGGKILQSAVKGEQTSILAVLPKDIELGTSLRLKSAPETIFKVQPLPYTIE